MSNQYTWGGATTIVGGSVFVLVIFVLQLLQADYDPLSQLISELVFGEYGGIMVLAFLGLSACSIGIQIAVIHRRENLLLQIILTVVSICFASSGYFTLANELEIHITLIAIAFVLSGLAMYLMPFQVGHANSLISRYLSWGLALSMSSSAVLGQTILPLGVGQRLTATFLLVWFTIVGWRFIQKNRILKQRGAI